MTSDTSRVVMGTLLIVDDEPQIRRVVRNTLAVEFARVIEASTGSAAIDLAAAERPDFVILDVGLPDGSGVAVCRELRKWLDSPILVLSARHAAGEGSDAGDLTIRGTKSEFRIQDSELRIQNERQRLA